MNGGRGSADGQAVLLVTATGDARGSDALAAALATCAADEHRTALLIEVGGDSRPRRPTLLASPAARRCESELRDREVAAAARGLICHLSAGDADAGLDRAAAAVSHLPGNCACVVHVEAALWLAALEHRGLRSTAGVIRAELPRDRSLAALAVRDLRRRGMGVRVAARPLGWAAGRRALAGVPFGGPAEAWMRRWVAVLLRPVVAAPLRPGCDLTLS